MEVDRSAGFAQLVEQLLRLNLTVKSAIAHALYIFDRPITINPQTPPGPVTEQTSPESNGQK